MKPLPHHYTFAGRVVSHIEQHHQEMPNTSDDPILSPALGESRVHRGVKTAGFTLRW
jgi:hypothetical protein